MKKLFLALFLILLLPVAAGAGETVRIPVVAPFSGPLAAFGRGVRNGARLKAEELNTNGGINGKPVIIEFIDDLGEPGAAAAVAARLAGDSRIAVVVGHVCSSATLAALPIYREARLPAITPASTNPAIGRSSPYYFRTIYQDDQQGAFLARYVRQARQCNRIAIFYQNNDYGLGLERAFVGKARELGLEIVGSAPYRAATTTFQAQLASFRMKQPDAIFIAGYAPQASLIISQARSLGITCAIFGGDGLDDGIMLENPDAEGLFVTTPFLADRGGAMIQDFVERYRQRFGYEADWLAASTYDAVGLAAAALIRAGCDRERIRAWLAGRKTPEKAYPGITGPICFDDYGDCRKPLLVKFVRDHRWSGDTVQLQP